MTPLPRIAITMGDPAGVGPEICLHLLNHAELARECVPIVFGDVGVLQRVAQQTGIPFQAAVISRAEWPTLHSTLTEPSVLDLQVIQADAVTPGQVSAACGEAAFQYVIASIEAGIAGEVAAVSTAPLNKEALHAAGHFYPGHTEIYAERMNAEHSCMTFFSEVMICSLVTVHIGYQDVVPALTQERILEVIELTAAAVHRVKGKLPRMAVCGLNPHAGEHGLFGRGEEEKIILPAIEIARQRGHQIEGPLPPDTAFIASKRPTVDAYICQYHDQALIPLKALAFDTAVNTTLGLPVPRTSVDHGTAFDIAWQGIANPSSLFAAVRLAVKLAQ